MPIAPPPVTYRCPACRWSKTVAPRSDALMPGDHFGACPVCDRAPLNTQPANALQAALARTALHIPRIRH